MVHWVARCTVLQDCFPPNGLNVLIHTNYIHVCSSVIATLWSLLIQVAPRLPPRGKWTPKHLNTEQIFFFRYLSVIRIRVTRVMAAYTAHLTTVLTREKTKHARLFSSRSLHAPWLLKVSLSPLPSCNLRGSYSGRRQAWQTPDSGPDAMGTVCLQWYVSYCDVTYV